MPTEYMTLEEAEFADTFAPAIDLGRTAPMSEQAEQSAGLLTESEPERYCRIAITRNTKGFTYETTISIQGAISLDQVKRELADLNSAAHVAARQEIAMREATETASAEQVAARVETDSTNGHSG